MPHNGITQIPYHPHGGKKSPLTNQQVNDLLVYGHPCTAEFVKEMYLRSAKTPFKKVPCVSEFIVLLEGRKKEGESDPRQLNGRLLYAQFRPDDPGININFNNTKPDTQPKRHIAAYSISMAAGVEIVPIAIKRDFSDLNNTTETSAKNPLAKLALAGPGTLTATVHGEPLFVHNFNLGRAVVNELIPFKRKTYVAALLFDMIIGSGQRDAVSYLIDDDGRVRTIYHHEAFTYTAQVNLCEHLLEEYPEVAGIFWEALQDVHGNTRKRDRLIVELEKYIQKAEIDRFYNFLLLLLKNKQVCGQMLAIG